MLSKGLDYLTLIREARFLNPAHCKTRIKIALLADCATQHLTTILRVLFARYGIAAEIYEAGYDTLEQEVYDASSGLYQFQPEYVVIIPTVWSLKKKYYGTSASSKKEFAGIQAERLQQIAAAIREKIPALIIQSNFVLPYERISGSHDLVLTASFYAAVQTINQRLVSYAQSVSNFLINDLDYLASYVGRKYWLDDKMWLLTKAMCSYDFLPLAAQSIVDIILSQRGRSVKCVVLDLDNTLWGGVIGDDGLEGIQLGHYDEGAAFVDLQHFLLELKQRGVLLAVCSKNDPEKAQLPFLKHPDTVLQLKDFAVFLANWQNKPENIRRLREILNIGFDSMVFLDDNPFERGVVREAIPELIVPELPEDPALYIRTLMELNLFEASSVSSLDHERTALYQKEAERKVAAMQFSDPRDYLQSLQMKIQLSRFDELNLPRILQLIQRSNQFNLMTQRFNQAQCENFMKDENYFPFYVQLKDKYGDNGLISVVILKFESREIHILEWLMSCRVLARGVEDYTMNAIFALAREKEIERVRGMYQPTAKNGMVKDFYEKFGFQKQEEVEGKTFWSLETSKYQPRETWMESEKGSEVFVYEPR